MYPKPDNSNRNDNHETRDLDDENAPRPRWFIETREVIAPCQPGLTHGQKKRRTRMLALLHMAEVEGIPTPRFREDHARLVLQWRNGEGDTVLSIDGMEITLITPGCVERIVFGGPGMIDTIRGALHNVRYPESQGNE